MTRRACVRDEATLAAAAAAIAARRKVLMRAA